jgi:hypothetical protein
MVVHLPVHYHENAPAFELALLDETPLAFLALALNEYRNFPATILSGKLLLRRDGRHSFGFLKNLSLQDVSPLVFV